MSYLRLINVVYLYCMGCAYDKSTASVSCMSNLQLTECGCHGFLIKCITCYYILQCNFFLQRDLHFMEALKVDRIDCSERDIF